MAPGAARAAVEPAKASNRTVATEEPEEAPGNGKWIRRDRWGGLGADDPSYEGRSAWLAPGLERLGTRVIVHRPARTLEDAYAQIARIGEATGHRAQARRVVSRVKRRVEEIVLGALITVTEAACPVAAASA